MSKNIGKIIRVDSLPPKTERLKNVIYQVAVPNTANYIDYAVDENGDIKTPTLESFFSENTFGKVKTVNNVEVDENGNVEINLQKILDKGDSTTNSIQFDRNYNNTQDFINGVLDDGVTSLSLNVTTGISHAVKVDDDVSYSNISVDGINFTNSISRDETTYMNGKIKVNNKFTITIPAEEGTLALKEDITLNTILETEEKATTDKRIRIKTGGSIYVNNGEDFDEKWSKFFYTSSSEDNVTVATGIFNQKAQTWNYPTFYGLGALYNLNTENIGNSKSYTTAIGTQSMYSFTGTLSNSSYNTALGYRSMYGLKGGLSNVAVGALTFKNLGEGSLNIALGTNVASLLTSGDRNVLIGHAIGETGFTSGSFNTIIGTFTEPILGNTLDNNVIIGSGVNRVCFRTSELGLTTIPQQTNSLINSDTTGKSVLTKEYLNAQNLIEILITATEEQKVQLKSLFS